MHPPILARGRRSAHGLAAALLLATHAALAAPATELSDEVLAAVNHYRQAHQLAPLRSAAPLQAIAAGHSQVLARQGRLSHGGFEQRLARSGALLCVENLAAGYVRGEAVLAAWRTSPGHHRNLLEPRVREVGIASVNGFVVMLACEPDGP